MPEISVILPVYKVEKYLRACVDSILEQTYIDFELIMVDDGSPDSCGTICEDYAKKNKRIRVIHQENKGLSVARNTGLDVAIGNYIAFIDSDDIVNIYYLEKLYHALVENDADVSACNYFIFCDEKTVDYKKKFNDIDLMFLRNKEAVESIYSESNDSIFVTAWGFLFKKNLFDNLRFPPGKIGEDLSLIPRVIYRANKVVWLKMTLYGYRKREGSITNQKCSLKIFDDIEAIEDGIEFFERVCEPDLIKAAESKRILTLSYYTLLARKYGFYRDLPAKYKMRMINAIWIQRRGLTLDQYFRRMRMLFPRYVYLASHFWRLLQIIGIKKR